MLSEKTIKTIGEINQMIEKEGVSARIACQRLGYATSSYYKNKKEIEAELKGRAPTGMKRTYTKRSKVVDLSSVLSSQNQYQPKFVFIGTVKELSTVLKSFEGVTTL